MSRWKTYMVLLVTAVAMIACTEKNPAVEAPSSQQPGYTTEKDPQQILSQDGRDRRLAWQKPELVIGKLGDLKDKVVADVGAGTGYFTFRLVNKADKVIAVDIDANSIQWINSFRATMDTTLQKKVEARLVLPDDPRLEENEVDVVIIINTIGYIEDRLAYLKNLKRSIKPGGLLMVVDFKMKRISKEIAPAPENRVAILDLENELELAGYHLIETDDTSLDYQYIILSAV